jgi:cell fate regulator YaaT (PSP1 superfamily)
MYVHHLVRIGPFGHVGRFATPDGSRVARHARVVCRTSRGLEVGEVLASGCEADGQPDGTLLRRVTVADELLLTRLERHKRQAFHACEQRIRERDLPTVLVEVEHLFDGRGLYFYFLGETTPAIEEITAELAEVYDAEVQFRRFSETLVSGCGPGCGTDEATGSGCGTGGCASCAVSGACAPKRIKA